MLKKIINICFDVDGVFFPNKPFAEEFTTVGNKLTGKDISIQNIFDVWGGSLHCLLPIFYPEISVDDYIKERVNLGFHLTKPQFLPGVENSLEILSKYFRLSILTNRKNESLVEDMKKANMNPDIFERIQTRDHTPFAKPDPRVFNDLLTAYKAEEIIYIGDHHKVDYPAAHGAGIHFAGVLSGEISTQEDFLTAGVPEHMILDSLAYLPPLFGL